MTEGYIKKVERRQQPYTVWLGGHVIKFTETLQEAESAMSAEIERLKSLKKKVSA